MTDTDIRVERPLPGGRVGLLGGSFNPAHDGHRHISVEALKRLQLDRVWWLVSPQNPLKPVHDMAPLAERLARARAVADHPRIVVTAIERRLGARYTADTLAALSRAYAETRFVWIMGADNMIQIRKWRHWQQIFHTVPIAIFVRPSYSFGAIGSPAAHRFARHRVAMARAGELADLPPPAWCFLHVRAHPASATALRKRRRGGASGR
ncbi:MAG: nicotinate-nucleotide adenylyltransferase [Alphaproteobacteria bacterium]|nr:nicotinate-nucleotide adenylyltransferase [Alphaproteobacteria bacterium]